MVQHREPNRTFWTLPGGAIEPGETPAEAGLSGKCSRRLACEL
jgi:ADP-ribose pyrophosphatase YjhB (NUDIX family)